MMSKSHSRITTVSAFVLSAALLLPLVAEAGLRVPVPPAPPGVDVHVTAGVPLPVPVVAAPGVVVVEKGGPREYKEKHRGKHEGLKKGHYKHKKHGH